MFRLLTVGLIVLSLSLAPAAVFSGAAMGDAPAARMILDQSADQPVQVAFIFRWIGRGIERRQERRQERRDDRREARGERVGRAC